MNKSSIKKNTIPTQIAYIGIYVLVIIDARGLIDPEIYQYLCFHFSNFRFIINYW